MSAPIEYTPSLIRLWRESGSGTRELTTDWQSEAEYIQTGRRWTFGTVDELLSFLRRQAEKPGVLDRPARE